MLIILYIICIRSPDGNRDISLMYAKSSLHFLELLHSQVLKIVVMVLAFKLLIHVVSMKVCNWQVHHFRSEVAQA